MRVKSGCGCMTVQTGARVLAGLSIISCVIGIIVLSIIYNGSDLQRDWETHNMNNQLRVLIVCCIVSCLMCIGFAGLMIYGSIRREPGWVFPYVALGYCGLVITVIACIASIIIGGIIKGIGYFFLSTLINVSWSVLHIYVWLIMYTHYKDLSAEKYGQRNPNDGKVFSQPMNA